MDFLHLSVIISSLGAFSIFLINIYLYAMYRERYMGIWAVSWLILISRYLAFDSGLFPWKQSTLVLGTYQTLIMISALMYAWGTHILVNKPLNKLWLYGVISISTLSIALNVCYSSLVYKLLIPTYICCFILLWIGFTFIRYFKPQGIGCLMTGYAFILWGLHTLSMPFTIGDSWFAPWGYTISGILCLIIAVGTLMTYFEKNRIDLLNKESQYRLLAIEGILRDITARNKLEQMTSRFECMNMVGSMAATVAHEIRNPMTTIRGYLQLLEKKEGYLADKEKFKLMIEEIDRANTIIGEYLAMSHERAIHFEICSLNHIIETLFPLIQVNATASKICTSLDLTAIPELLLDENEIRQLLLNLVRNSIEAMPSGGNLTIGTFLEDSNAILSISDQGSGIPSQVLENLGTPFITTKDTGTGLGLPICYQIAHRHNAIIKINTSDEGTTFFIYFTLPIL